MRKLIRYIKLPLDTQINFSTHPNSKFPIPRIKSNQAQTTISESSSTNTLLYTRLHDGQFRVVLRERKREREGVKEKLSGM